MADSSDDKKLDKTKQVIGGQRSHQSEYGDQLDQKSGSGAAPPRSMGTHGSEFGQFGDATGPAGQQGQSGTGQADLGSQAGSTLAGRSDQQELGGAGGVVDPPASYGGEGAAGQSHTGQSHSQGEGFILQQGSGSDDLEQRESGSSAKATEGSDFAPQGRGAVEEETETSNQSQSG